MGIGLGESGDAGGGEVAIGRVDMLMTSMTRVFLEICRSCGRYVKGRVMAR